MDGASEIRAILRADPLRWHLLGLVAALNLADGWVAAGFVRTAVWDHLHGRPPSPPPGDVDVIWYDPVRPDPAEDRRHEAILRAAAPSIAWSVKNQARMHRRNRDAPYRCATDAMRYWPETATAVAVRRRDAADCDVAAPFGLDDLFGLVLRPAPAFTGERRGIFDERVRSKGWTAIWPLLRDGAPTAVQRNRPLHLPNRPLPGIARP